KLEASQRLDQRLPIAGAEAIHRRASGVGGRVRAEGGNVSVRDVYRECHLTWGLRPRRVDGDHRRPQRLPVLQGERQRGGRQRIGLGGRTIRERIDDNQQMRQGSVLLLLAQALAATLTTRLLAAAQLGKQ